MGLQNFMEVKLIPSCPSPPPPLSQNRRKTKEPEVVGDTFIKPFELLHDDELLVFKATPRSTVGTLGQPLQRRFLVIKN